MLKQLARLSIKRLSVIIDTASVSNANVSAKRLHIHYCTSIVSVGASERLGTTRHDGGREYDQ